MTLQRHFDQHTEKFKNNDPNHVFIYESKFDTKKIFFTQQETELVDYLKQVVKLYYIRTKREALKLAYE